jgi:hypothetical protein
MNLIGFQTYRTFASDALATDIVGDNQESSSFHDTPFPTKKPPIFYEANHMPRLIGLAGNTLLW